MRQKFHPAQVNFFLPQVNMILPSIQPRSLTQFGQMACLCSEWQALIGRPISAVNHTPLSETLIGMASSHWLFHVTWLK
jgi:hypothetical protein